MSYNVRVKITKTDDNPWFWLDDGPTGRDITSLVKQLCEIGRGQGWVELLDSLLKTEPVNLHEAIWEIPCRDENHAQETTMTLISWLNAAESPLVAELEALFFQHYPDWTESIVVDPV
jgi:hypothetical protein